MKYLEKYKWGDYYSNFSSWSETEAMQKLSCLVCFGDADEVYELAMSLSSKKLMNEFIKRALDDGVRFKPQHALNFYLLVEDEVFERMVLTSTPKCNRRELEELFCLINGELFDLMSKRSRIKIFSLEDDGDRITHRYHSYYEEGEDEEEDYFDEDEDDYE